MQKKKNDVKARTTLLLSLPDEHQLRFSKYKTARELWAAILKTFGGNEATKKRKKNLLKQQYGNFKTEGTETLEQTFNRLQVIVSQLQFMDVDIEKDDLNQKFLTNIEKDDLNQKFFTSLAPEWLIHTIVWRNRNDLDSMSLDDLYNHLKVYEAEVQKKPTSNPQDMSFISSSKNINNEDGNTVCVTTATTPFPTNEVVYKELGDSLITAATTTSILEVKQDSDNITKTQYKATPNESSSQGTNSDGGHRCQETIRDTITQTRVLDLEKTKTTQCNEIDSLKRRVKKLEKRNGSRTHKLKRLYKVGLSARVESSGDEESLGEDASKQGRRIDVIDADEDITVVNDADNEMFDVDILGGEEMFVTWKNENVVKEVVDAAQVSTTATTVTITTEEITLAQALKALKTSKPKVK
nr:hypothetical protein [Tanacetum cinerariifolium]